MFSLNKKNAFLSINNHLTYPDIWVISSICETRISYVIFVDILWWRVQVAYSAAMFGQPADYP